MPAEDNEKENDIIQTITRYQQIILENPDSIEARLSLGLAYFSHDLLEEATLAFHQVIELDSKSREGNYSLGRTYQSQKKYEKYIVIFQELIRQFLKWHM